MSHERHSDRFDPARQGWEQYIQESTSERDKDLRIHFVLNSVVTGLTETLRRKTMLLSAEGLYVPRLSGKEPEIKAYSPVRQRGVNKFQTMSGRDFPQYQWYCVSEQPYGFFSMLRTPVTKYGSKVAYDTIQAGRAMYTLIDETMEEACNAVDTTYGPLLEAETDQGKSRGILREAAQTTVATFGLLTPTLVPGFTKDPMGLYQAIVDGKQMNRIASQMPLGHVIPMVGHGVYHPRPLLPEDGDTALSPDFVGYMHHRRELSLAQGPGRPKERKFGCPGARENTPVIIFDHEACVVKDSSVQQMAILMLPYIKYFSTQDASGLIAS